MRRDRDGGGADLIRARRGSTRQRRRRQGYLIAAGLLLEVLPVWLRTHRLGGEMVVRCRQGHLFTTLWIPGLSVKGLRLGPIRIQRCPVGHHWTIVGPSQRCRLRRGSEPPRA